MIDLHVHTNYSDGSDTLLEVLKKANDIGLEVLSITDHNSCDAYLELNNINNYYNGKIIIGCEITTSYKGETIEVLGYGFDLNKMVDLLNENVLKDEEKKIKEFELIKKRFNEIGVKYDINNIKFDPKIGSSRILFCNEIKKYKENDEFFYDKNSITSKMGFTRNEIYNPKSPLYVDETLLYPTLDKTISIIHETGGKTFLAHTFAYSKTIAESLDDIYDNYEFDGIECFYTTFSDEQSEYLLEFAKKRNLLISGGSDYHGTNKINHELGIGRGNLNINKNILNNWNINYFNCEDKK